PWCRPAGAEMVQALDPLPDRAVLPDRGDLDVVKVDGLLSDLSDPADDDEVRLPRLVRVHGRGGVAPGSLELLAGFRPFPDGAVLVERGVLDVAEILAILARAGDQVQEPVVAHAGMAGPRLREAVEGLPPVLRDLALVVHGGGLDVVVQLVDR